MRLLRIGRNFWIGLFLLVAGIGFASNANAQAFRIAVGPGVAFGMSEAANDLGVGLGVDLQGRYVMDSRVGLGVNTGIYYQGIQQLDNADTDWFTVIPAAVAGEFYFLPSTSRVRPYLGMEAGAYTVTTHMESVNEFGTLRSSNHTTVDAGVAPALGLQFWVAPNIGINLKSNYRYILTDRDQPHLRNENMQLWTTSAAIELEF